MCIGQLCRCHDLLERRSRLSVADVLGDTAAEQDRLLRYHADLLPQVLQSDTANIYAIDLDDSLIDIVEPGHQVDRRRLSHT